jgi:hypothetical protein
MATQVGTSTFFVVIKWPLRFFDIFRVKSKLGWYCLHSVARLADRNRIQLVWVPGHMGIDGNKIADQLARRGCSHPLTGPEPTLGVSGRAEAG